MIFILAAEVLTFLYRKEKALGKINVFKVKRSGFGNPIIQFTDVMLVLVDCNVGKQLSLKIFCCGLKLS